MNSEFSISFSCISFLSFTTAFKQKICSAIFTLGEGWIKPTNLNTSFGPSNMVPLNEMEGKEKQLGEGENSKFRGPRGKASAFLAGRMIIRDCKLKVTC